MADDDRDGEQVTDGGMRARGYWDWRADGQRLYVVDGAVVGSVIHLRRVPYAMDAGWYAWAAPLCVLKVGDVSEGMTLVELCARPPFCPAL